jgi:hypothetical protein
MQTVSDLSAAAALTSVGAALANPAWPTSFKKSRRLHRGVIFRDIAATPSPDDKQEWTRTSNEKHSLIVQPQELTVSVTILLA